MVLPRFVSQALSGQPITVYGEGNQSRCLTWVGDVVNALIQLAQTREAIGEIFNVGGTEEMSIRDLAYLVKQVTKSKSEVIFVPYDQAYEKGFEDMERRVPSIEKIHSLIGYKPTLDVVGITTRVVEHLKSRELAYRMMHEIIIFSSSLVLVTGTHALGQILGTPLWVCRPAKRRSLA